VVSRRTKSTLMYLTSPLMRLNGILFRKFKASRKGYQKIHLGPGQRNYIQGWINLDMNIITGKCDVWCDLRYPLPFHDSTITAAYSHHVIEHLPDLHSHFSEVCRCLKPGGVYRVGGPNGDAAIMKFIDNDKAWFSDFPDSYKSIGGRLNNFIFCRNEHMVLLTYSYLEELMNNAGFVNIKSCLPGLETHYQEYFEECINMEDKERDLETSHTLIVEGVKLIN
jgi:predicted SAM-dependent methyltransferase